MCVENTKGICKVVAIDGVERKRRTDEMRCSEENVSNRINSSLFGPSMADVMICENLGKLRYAEV